MRAAVAFGEGEPVSVVEPEHEIADGVASDRLLAAADGARGNCDARAGAGGCHGERIRRDSYPLEYGRPDPLILLVLAVALLSWPTLRVALPLTDLRWPLVLAAAAFLASLILLPPAGYLPGGHEGLYLTAAAGMSVDPGEEGPFATMPVAFAIAQALGRLGDPGATVWLVLNRMGLPVAMLCAAGLGLAAAPSVPGAGRRGGSVAAALVGCCIPLHAWSATGFFVAPAVAFAGLALLVAAHGRPSLALGWGAFAVGARLEMLPVVVVALVASFVFHRLLRTRREPPGTALVAFAAAGWVGFDLWSRGRPPFDSAIPAADVALSNLAALPLLGPLANPLAAALALLLVLIATFTTTGPRLDPQRRRGALLSVALGVAGFLSIVSVLPLVDLGARHFLPAGLVAAALLGGAAGRTQRPLGWVLVAVVAVVFARGVPDLLDTHAAGDASAASSWNVTPLPEGATVRCTLLQEGALEGPGVGAFSGAELLATRGARCLVIDAPDAHVFRGDARADRLARAHLLHPLQPRSYQDQIVWYAAAQQTPPPVSGTDP